METILPEGVGPAVAIGLVALAFLTSALTAAAGIGGGLVLLSVLASMFPPAVVLPVHGVVQLGSTVGRAAIMRRHLDRRLLAWFVGGAVVGVALAARVFVALPADAIRLAMGAFVLWATWGPKVAHWSVSARAFALVGAGSTFLTLFIGATGPFVASFLSPERLGRHVTVGTHAACMSVQHALKTAAFGVLGFAYLPWLVLLAAMVGFGFLGTLAGRAVLERLPERAFRVVFRVVLTVLAARLLWVGVTGLVG